MLKWLNKNQNEPEEKLTRGIGDMKRWLCMPEALVYLKEIERNLASVKDYLCYNELDDKKTAFYRGKIDNYLKMINVIKDARKVKEE